MKYFIVNRKTGVIARQYKSPYWAHKCLEKMDINYTILTV